MKSIYVLYHFPCADGFGAAFAAWKKFGATAEYIPVNYGKPLPAIPDGSEVYILDFSYSKAVLQELHNRCQVKLLDHHATALNELQGEPYVELDMHRSGASMAWDFFHPGKERPWLFNYLEDRDLWLHKLPFTEAINLALSSYEFNFEVWDKLPAIEELKKDGELLIRYRTQIIDDILRNTHMQTVVGHANIPSVNTNALVSDVGQALLDKYPEAPFVAIYFSTGDKVKWSLRSQPHRANVAQLAESKGGGGHKTAAGFIERK